MEAKILIEEVREMIKFFEDDKEDEFKSQTMKSLDDWLVSKMIEHKFRERKKRSLEGLQ